MSGRATIAVADRVGNMLAVLSNGTAPRPSPASGPVSSTSGSTGPDAGLEIPVFHTPRVFFFAAITKAITAYLSSEERLGTRARDRIVRLRCGRHGQPWAPVQCPVRPTTCKSSSEGGADQHQAAPFYLGLSADPGVPLFFRRARRRISIIADRILYGVDADILGGAGVDQLIAGRRRCRRPEPGGGRCSRRRSPAWLPDADAAICFRCPSHRLQHVDGLLGALVTAEQVPAPVRQSGTTSPAASRWRPGPDQYGPSRTARRLLLADRRAIRRFHHRWRVDDEA